jgi:hypothetical protein
MKEKLQEYASIAEIIGAIAIVVSLLFVGIQVKQSNSIATTDAIQTGTQHWLSAYRETFGSTESAMFFRKAINHCDDLSNDERARFFYMLGEYISAFDNIYNQYINGRLPKEIFVSIGTGYFGVANMPCAQQMLTQEFPRLAPWLISYSGIQALADHTDEMVLPSFMVE